MYQIIRSWNITIYLKVIVETSNVGGHLCVLSVSIWSLFQRFFVWILEVFRRCRIFFILFYIEPQKGRRIFKVIISF